LNGEFELRKFLALEFVFGSNDRFFLGRYQEIHSSKSVSIIDQGIISTGWLEEIIGALLLKLSS